MNDVLKPLGGSDQENNALLSVQARWVGPLPPPAILAAFGEIVPNGAERIVAEWEQETRHRRACERRALNAEIVERLGSRLLAFLFALSALAVSAYCATSGHDTVAGVIGGTTIATVVGAFIYGQTKSHSGNTDAGNPAPKPSAGKRAPRRKS